MELNSLLTDLKAEANKAAPSGKTVGYILIGILVLAITALIYTHFKPKSSITQTTFSKPTEMKGLPETIRIAVPAPKIIYVYPEAQVVKASPALAAEVAKTPEKKVLATATLPESKNGYDTAAVMDNEGKTDILVKEKTSPLFQFRNDLSAGARAGFALSSGNTGTPYAGDIHVDWKFIRVKGARMGLYGEAGVIGNQGYGKVMLGIDFDIN
jgi:hypothetical protein